MTLAFVTNHARVGQRLWQERSMTAAATTAEGAVEIQVAVSVFSPKRRAVVEGIASAVS